MTALGPYLRRGTLSSRVQSTLDADGLVLRPWRDDDAAVATAMLNRAIGCFRRIGETRWHPGPRTR
ncbi:hypothetical protein [Arthrobacter sp. zg-Y179]|uniref:hypothetical protein n=1 Tax=Arthrobacter sp. zg-Y179 TaxID=2894188 RepID=UPI002F40DD0F|nr:hypothetical protein [Arthrobacter sp. zg-Y179]